MDELIKTFHIDWKLLIAQIINFGIVLGVLWYFALRPLLKVMHARSGDIAKSLKNAEEVEKKLKQAEQAKEDIITEAKKESQIIVLRANKEADKVRDAKLSETRQEMEKIAAKTKADLQREKENMIMEAKQEVAGLIIVASEKVVQKELDEASNRKLIDETISHVK